MYAVLQDDKSGWTRYGHDPDGNPCKDGETGEIIIRTDKKIPCGLFKEYYRNEEKTKEAWHDGMYHTGDTAWHDEQGYYWYVGRIDDVIKSSGYRIGPFEIECVCRCCFAEAYIWRGDGE